MCAHFGAALFTTGATFKQAAVRLRSRRHGSRRALSTTLAGSRRDPASVADDGASVPEDMRSPPAVGGEPERLARRPPAELRVTPPRHRRRPNRPRPRPPCSRRSGTGRRCEAAKATRRQVSFPLTGALYRNRRCPGRGSGVRSRETWHTPCLMPGCVGSKWPRPERTHPTSSSFLAGSQARHFLSELVKLRSTSSGLSLGGEVSRPPLGAGVNPAPSPLRAGDPAGSPDRHRTALALSFRGEVSRPPLGAEAKSGAFTPPAPAALPGRRIATEQRWRSLSRGGLATSPRRRSESGAFTPPRRRPCRAAGSPQNSVGAPQGRSRDLPSAPE